MYVCKEYPVLFFFELQGPWPRTYLYAFEFPLSFSVHELHEVLMQKFSELEMAVRSGPIDCSCVRQAYASHAAIQNFCNTNSGKQYQPIAPMTGFVKKNKNKKNWSKSPRRDNQGQNSNQNSNQNYGSGQGPAHGNSQERNHKRSYDNRDRSRDSRN